MVNQALGVSKAWMGLKEMKDTEGSRDYLGQKDYR